MNCMSAYSCREDSRGIVLDTSIIALIMEGEIEGTMDNG
jgi:hypothetical protein